MPKGVLKFVPLAALGLMGYLVYSLVGGGSPPQAAGKEPPSVPKSMLRPNLVVAQDHASPAGRDPFEVVWASYLHWEKDAPAGGSTKPGARPMATQTAAATGSAGAAAVTGSAGSAAVTGSAGSAADPPPEPVLPPLPAQVTSVVLDASGNMAIIDGHVYHVGELIRGATAGAGWVVESIDPENVVLKFADVRKILPITRAGSQEAEPKGVPEAAPKKVETKR